MLFSPVRLAVALKATTSLRSVAAPRMSAAVACARLTPSQVPKHPVWLTDNVPFQYKYGYIKNERSGVESYS